VSEDRTKAAPLEMNLSSFLHVILAPVAPLLRASDTATLRATVHNTAPHPITILTYNGLLDKAAGVLGIIHVTDSSTGEEVHADEVKFRKVWPPTRESFVEMAPDGKVEVEIPLRGHKLEAGKKYDVKAKWAWQSLREGGIDAAVEASSAGDNAEGSSRSPTIEVVMEGRLEVDKK
jgi:hypothetical protein